jgi:hypothetical protein
MLQLLHAAIAAYGRAAEQTGRYAAICYCSIIKTDSEAMLNSMQVVGLSHPFYSELTESLAL